jgi:hypothetical protein
MWGRIGDEIKYAARLAKSSGVAHILSAEEFPDDPDLDWHLAALDNLPALRRWEGCVWLATDAADPPLLPLAEGCSFGAAICWWQGGELRIAALGSAEPDVLPYMPLPIVRIRPAGVSPEAPKIHQIVVPWPGHQLLCLHELQHPESKADHLCALASRLARLTLIGLGKIQARERAAGRELGRPVTDPIPYLPVRPRLIADPAELTAAIVDLWSGGKVRGLETWQILDLIHHELFAGRERTPCDYAAVMEAHWTGFYATGSNIYSPDSWHMILKGGAAPREGWCEPWFPDAQRSASERYARNPTLEELLPGGRIPADADPVELRRTMPFGFGAASTEVFVELARELDPRTARFVLFGANKHSTPWWLDPHEMLDELLAPYRPQK